MGCLLRKGGFKISFFFYLFYEFVFCVGNMESVLKREMGWCFEGSGFIRV